METKTEYFPVVNMLRGIAALMVCFYHFTHFTNNETLYLEGSNYLIQLGSFGVQGVFVFFVITGFVIPLTLEKYNFTLQKMPRYLAKRWIRIEIPYLFSIVFLLALKYFYYLKSNTPFDVPIGSLLHHFFYTVAFSKYDWFNTIYWTLAIEFQFYILIALLFPLLNSKTNWLRVSAFILFSLSAMVIPSHNLVFYYSPIFAQGIILFFAKRHGISMPQSIVFLLFFAAFTAYIHTITIALFTLATSIVILIFNVDRPVWNRLGNYSYSLYLTHGLIGGTVLIFFGKHTETFVLKLFGLILAFCTSILFAHFFCKWIENRAKHLSKNVKI